MPADLSALAQEVDPDSVNALLLARAPDVLDEDDERHGLYLEALEGASAEVEAVAGPDPQPLARRRIALRAIAFGVAADLEESLFPEQNVGDGARAAYLRRRYDELIKLLQAQDAVGLAPAVPAPLGNFPLPSRYPDPAEVRRSDWAGRGYYPC